MNNDLISRKELKKTIQSDMDKVEQLTDSDKRWIKYFNDIIDNALTVKFSLMPADESKEEAYMRGYEKGKIAGILKANTRPQGEWIPVSERLPNRNGVYNVTRIIDGTRITDACYFDGQNTWHRDTGVNHGRPYLDDIIAWQPLPEPYKKGGAKE